MRIVKFLRMAYRRVTFVKKENTNYVYYRWSWFRACESHKKPWDLWRAAKIKSDLWGKILPRLANSIWAVTRKYRLKWWCLGTSFFFFFFLLSSALSVIGWKWFRFNCLPACLPTCTNWSKRRRKCAKIKVNVDLLLSHEEDLLLFSSLLSPCGQLPRMV